MRRIPVPARLALRSPPFGRGLFWLAVALLLSGSRAEAAALTLEDAIRLALTNNQRVKVSGFSPEISRANVLAAYGRFEPALTFDRRKGEQETPGPLRPTGTRKTNTYDLSLGGVAPWGMRYALGASADSQQSVANNFTTQYVTFGGVNVTQPLLRGAGFGANLAGLRVAKANRGISDWQHKQTVIDTVTLVIIAYNNLIEARDSLRIAQGSRDLARQLFTDNQRKHAIGTLSDADVTQAQAVLASREEAILISERRVRDIENNLRLLIGDTAFKTAGPELEIAELAPPPELVLEPAADLKRAYDLRPDYQMARLGLTVDRANYSFQWNQLLPQLDFVGRYGYAGVDADFGRARQQVRDKNARDYSAGLVVSIPLGFTEGRGRARAARLTLRQSEADLVRLEQDIAVSVTNAAGQIETTRQRVAATRTALELATQALEAEQKRFQAGTGTTFLVLQQQAQLSGVQNSHARALADQRRAIALYESELGTTLATHRIALE